MKVSILFLGLLLIILNALSQINPTEIHDILFVPNSSNTLSANVIWVITGESIFVLLLAILADSGTIGNIISVGTLTLIWMIWFLSHTDIFLGNTSSGNVLGFLGNNLFGKATK
jgi:hypothetical protein